MRKILCIFALLLPCSLRAANATPSPEEKAMNAALLYCLPAADIGQSAAAHAQYNHLQELDRATNALGKDAEHIFVVDAGNTILLTHDTLHICQIAVSKADMKSMNKMIEQYFGSSKILQDSSTKGMASETIRERIFQDGMKNSVQIRISQREPYVNGAVQALLTFSPLKQ